MLRNFLTLSAGEAVARGLHALGILILVRFLQPEAFGTFELAVSIASYAALAVQLGVESILIRDASRHPERIGTQLRLVLGLRLRLVVPVMAVMLGAAWWNRGSDLGVLLSVFSALCLVQAVQPRFLFLALERPVPSAVSAVLAQIVFAAGVVLTVRRSADAWQAALLWVLGEAAAVAALWLWIDKKHRTGAAPEPGARLRLVRETAPLTVGALAALLLYNFDVLALGALGTRADIGFYLAAYRCTTVFMTLIQQFQAAVLPRLIRQQRSGKDLATEGQALLLPLLATFSLISLLLVGLATPLLTVLFGASYAQSAGLLRILAWTLPLQAIRTLARQVLVAQGRQTTDMRNSLWAAGCNIFLDLSLIPVLGTYGCAISTLLSTALLAFTNWHSVSRR